MFWGMQKLDTNTNDRCVKIKQWSQICAEFPPPFFFHTFLFLTQQSILKWTTSEQYNFSSQKPRKITLNSRVPPQKVKSHLGERIILLRKQIKIKNQKQGQNVNLFPQANSVGTFHLTFSFSKKWSWPTRFALTLNCNNYDFK